MFRDLKIGKILIFPAVFVAVIALMLCFSLAAVYVPRENIRSNMESSAGLLTERQVFFDIIEGIPASKIDRYADSILLSIAWQYDKSDPLKSLMWSSYYNYPLANENDNFRASLENDLPANTQYLRYWHGSASIVRFLHLFLDLKGIYVLHGILLALLTLALCLLLYKKGFLPLCIGTALSMAAVAAWFVPLSLEYTWTFLIMLIISIIALFLETGKHSGLTLILFFISGMVTNYLDFLTTETLTLCFPLIIVLFIRIEKAGACNKEHRRFACISALLWGTGYVLTWVTKWLLAAVILKENTLPYVTEHIEERVSGDIGLSPLGYISGALFRNLSCLFPLGFGAAGIIAGIIIILFIIYNCHVYRKKNVDRMAVILFLIIGILPYVRYMALHNHSFLHYFFTYRAQAATILSLSAILYHSVNRRFISR